jgi:DNA-binding PadR family transcriptional regulator
VSNIYGMASVRSSPLALTVLALLHYKPLHPYGLQQLIKQWGKDQVVNVSQRASLHRTIDRLCAAGLISVRETTRDRAYPQRTVYELTDAGRSVARQWLHEMLATAKQEYPEFPAALSHLPMTTPQEALRALRQRAEQLAQRRQALQADLAAYADQLPRVTTLETEYLLAVTEAEERWAKSIVDELGTGDLTWSAEQMAAADHSTTDDAAPA